MIPDHALRLPRLRLKFRKQFGLSHDILRHTFIQMFVGKFRSMGEAALQAGNSESDHPQALPRPEKHRRGGEVLEHRVAAISSSSKVEPRNVTLHQQAAA